MRTYESANAVEDRNKGVIFSYPQSPVTTSTIDWRQSVYLFLKRMMDVTLSTLALIVLSPLFLLVAAAIKLDSRGPVFFIHKRVGQNGEELNLYKFRSMVSNAKELFEQFTPEQKREFEQNYKLDNDPRITKLGNILRTTSLDELPQLINILKGDLSIIGPRPVVEKELDKYGIMSYRFLSVKPGLSGYWQVNGRSAKTYEERMALELYYVEHASLLLDIKILLKSFVVVFKCIGAK